MVTEMRYQLLKLPSSCSLCRSFIYLPSGLCYVTLWKEASLIKRFPFALNAPLQTSKRFDSKTVSDLIPKHSENSKFPTTKLPSIVNGIDIRANFHMVIDKLRYF